MGGIAGTSRERIQHPRHQGRPPTSSPGAKPPASAGANSRHDVAAVVINAALTTKQVVPKPKNSRHGASGTLVANLQGTKLGWSIVLTGLTGKATRVQLYAGTPGPASTPIALLCKNCKATASGVVSLTPATAAELATGKVYPRLRRVPCRRESLRRIPRRARRRGPLGPEFGDSGNRRALRGPTPLSVGSTRCLRLMLHAGRNLRSPNTTTRRSGGAPDRSRRSRLAIAK
jgi:hypothetical protein